MTTDTLDAATSAAPDPMPHYQDAHPPLLTDYRAELDAWLARARIRSMAPECGPSAGQNAILPGTEAYMRGAITPPAQRGHAPKRPQPGTHG